MNQFLPYPAFRNPCVLCLSEIAELDLSEYPQYISSVQNLYLKVMQQLLSFLPTTLGLFPSVSDSVPISLSCPLIWLHLPLVVVHNVLLKFLAQNIFQTMRIRTIRPLMMIEIFFEISFTSLVLSSLNICLLSKSMNFEGFYSMVIHIWLP